MDKTVSLEDFKSCAFLFRGGILDMDYFENLDNRLLNK
jgi:hypothetical protein